LESSRTAADYVCDGTNDQVQVQAALDTGEVSISLTEGTFYISDDIHMGTGDTLKGQGKCTILKVPDEHNADIHIIEVGNASYTTLSSFCIDGNRTNQSAGDQQGIYMLTGIQHKITDLWIVNIYGTEGNGIFVEAYPTDILIQGCTIDNIQDDGLDINAISKSQILGNSIINCGDNGIDTEGSLHCVFSGNIIVDCNGSGMELENEGGASATAYNTFEGNTVLNSGLDGVHIRNGSNNTVSGNTIKSSGRYGVFLGTIDGNSNYNVIADNIIIDGTGIGICEDAGEADYNLITGNILYGNGERDIQNTGAHTQVMDNFTGTSHRNIERKFLTLKNNSGAQVAANSVVVCTGTDEYSFTTTTAKGDDLVLGILLDITDGKGAGHVLTTGYGSIKVNGTDDIVAGDLLSTYSEAGIACKAGVGDMAFAIALQPYSGDDSSGTITCILISPRKL